uniref:ligand-binding sensor domain-containing protein n=1 Tax=Ningiella ruwaisensis TaxID=2364274 RepID=UPI00109F651A|nr:ligand-binding sensor domain-containing diguanylate cyclase [Ningiella ruwaisensis]
MYRLKNIFQPIVNFIKALLILTFLPSTSFAAIDNVRFEHFYVEQGLSQQSIMALYQDSKGFIWLGTQEGLNRYDGRKFVQYTKSTDIENDNSLIAPFVNAIAEDHSGQIWVATREGVSRFNTATDTFVNYRADGSDKSINDLVVRDVFVSKSGDVWVATRKGLNKYLPVEDRFKPYNLTNLDGIGVDFFKVEEDMAGGLWLGSDKDGLYRFDPVNEQFTRIIDDFIVGGEKQNGNIRALLIDTSQRLWIGTSNLGTFTLDLTQPKTESALDNVVVYPQMDKVSAIDIHQDSHGNLWFGTENGLAYIDKEGVFGRLNHHSDDNTSLSDDMVTSVIQDDGGVLWVGTFKGLNKWNTVTTQFDHYEVTGREKKSLSGNNITSITQIDDKRVFISSRDGADILHLDTKQIEKFYVPGVTKESASQYRVMSSAIVKNNELWLGTNASGAIRINLSSGEFESYRSGLGDKDKSLQANGVTSIFVDKDDTVWLSTYGGGLSKYNRQTNDFTTYRSQIDDIYSLSSDKLMSIMQAHDGNLWLGTWDNGITIFNPKTESAYRVLSSSNGKEGLGAKQVWVIYEDEQRNIWVGTHGSGINFLSATDRDNAQLKFTSIGMEDGLPSNVIFGILPDNSGNLWLSSNRGLTKLNRSTLETITFTHAQGLRSKEFNSGSYARLTNGKLMFGGPNGVTGFRPEDVRLNNLVPTTVITTFRRLDQESNIQKELNEEQTLVVDYTDYLIEFNFVSLHFTAPEKNQYKYRLTGFDEDWVKVRDIPRATYTNLPAGDYTFEVISSNSDGVWNMRPASVKLSVLPAPWESSYAYAAYTLLLVLLLYFIYRWYNSKLQTETRYRQALEVEVDKRTQELSAANEKLLKASITDQLTGLYNRRYLSDIIQEKSRKVYERFIAAQERNQVDHENGPRLFFLMFDLDGFKPINDTYGHDAGDKMIRQVAALLQEVCRIDDIVIRWGGDEFLVIGEINKLEEVASLAERIRTNIAKQGFDIGLTQRMHLSSSLGFSTYPFSYYCPDSLSWEQVHLIADNALYKSKDAGRNTWTGIVQAKEFVPFTIMNSLSQNIDKAIEDKHVNLIQHQPKK